MQPRLMQGSEVKRVARTHSSSTFFPHFFTSKSFGSQVRLKTFDCFVILVFITA